MLADAYRHELDPTTRIAHLAELERIATRRTRGRGRSLPTSDRST